MKKNRMVMGIEIMASTSKGLNRGKTTIKTCQTKKKGTEVIRGNETFRWIKDGGKLFPFSPIIFQKALLPIYNKSIFIIYTYNSVHIFERFERCYIVSSYTEYIQ